jgi:UPF0176 protein
MTTPTVNTTPIVNAAFYMFTDMSPLAGLRDELLAHPSTAHIKGSVILSYEGVNGMLAGQAEHIDAFLDALTTARPELAKMPIKRSFSEHVPFQKLLIKTKAEIVTMRVDDVDAIHKTGDHLAPEQLRDWLRQGKEMVFIDVRNDFECELGTFKGAINPKTDVFHQFPDYVKAHQEAWKGKDVVMFCTGGIRCEKATSWMLDEGFDQVYQLDGGVLNYFAQIPDAEQDWEGDLFVFDERVTLDTKLEASGMTIADLKARFPSQRDKSS